MMEFLRPVHMHTDTHTCIYAHACVLDNMMIHLMVSSTREKYLLMFNLTIYAHINIYINIIHKYNSDKVPSRLSSWMHY